MNLISPRSLPRQASASEALEHAINQTLQPLCEPAVREVPVGLDAAGICSTDLARQLLGKSSDVNELFPIPFLIPDAAKRRAKGEEEEDADDDEADDDAEEDEVDDDEAEEDEDLEEDEDDLDEDEDEEDEDDDDEEFDDPDEDDDFDDDDDEDEFDDEDE